MNVATEALKQSTLYASSIQGGNIDYDRFRYDLEKSYPNVFKDRHVAKEFVGLKNASLGSSDSTEISAFGLAREMYLKTTISYTRPANATLQCPNVAAHLYKAIISRVALLNSSREIAQLYGDTLQWRAISKESQGEKMKWLLAGKHNLQLGSRLGDFASVENSATEIVLANGTPQTITFYTELPWSFFTGKFQSDNGMKTSALSNYRFLETCRVLVETAPAHEVVTGTSTTDIANLKIDKMELMVNYDIPSSSDMMEIEKQYDLSTPLSCLVGNEVLTESNVTATADGDLTHSVKIFNSNLTKGFLVVVHKQRAADRAKALGAAITAGTSNGTDVIGGGTYNDEVGSHVIRPHMSNYHSVAATDDSRFGQDYKKVSSLSIKSSGRVLFEAKTYEQLLFCTSSMTNWVGLAPGANTEVSQMADKNGCNGVNFYWIPFCENGHSNSFTGGLALKGLSTVDVEVTFPAIDAKTYVVKVYSIHHTILSVDANTGRIIQSVSS